MYANPGFSKPLRQKKKRKKRRSFKVWPVTGCKKIKKIKGHFLNEKEHIRLTPTINLNLIKEVEQVKWFEFCLQCMAAGYIDVQI